MNARIFLLLLSISVMPSAYAIDNGNILRRELIAPSEADSRLNRFDEENVVTVPRVFIQNRLLLILAGTSTPPISVDDFAAEAAANGYRVISLEYDNSPSVDQACADSRDSSCYSRVRRKRCFGTSVATEIEDRPEESIVERFRSLLLILQRRHPNERWGKYLKGSEIRWSSIAIGGHSQGAGMAAFIAKRYSVQRVILLSGPWDANRSSGSVRSAPWLTERTATPINRWFATFHKNENMANALQASYSLLRIPPWHIWGIDTSPDSRQSYHSSTILNKNNRASWDFLLAGPTKYYGTN